MLPWVRQKAYITLPVGNVGLRRRRRGGLLGVCGGEKGAVSIGGDEAVSPRRRRAPQRLREREWHDGWG